MARKHKKSKPLKKHTAKELALKNARSLAKMKAEVDTKWKDTSSIITAMDCFPETTNASVTCLNAVPPLNVKNTAASDQFLNTSNARIGNKIYISGLYLKMQAYWNTQDEPSTDQRYPPYCHVNWAVVRQKNAVQGVEANVADFAIPTPLDVWQNPAQTDAVLTDDPDENLGGGGGALNNLLFQNMNNSKNYQVIKKGCIYLPGPGNVNTAPAETSTDDQITTFTPASLANTETRAFGGSLAKTWSLNLHPKCQTQFFQADIEGTDQTTTNQDLTFPIKNAIYLMYWVDVGGASSRFRPPPGSGYVYTLPELTFNCRCRYRDL